jgi:hypothetical protein
MELTLSSQQHKVSANAQLRTFIHYIVSIRLSHMLLSGMTAGTHSGSAKRQRCMRDAWGI